MKIDSRIIGILGFITIITMATPCVVREAAATNYKTIKTISVGKNVGASVTWQVTASEEDVGKDYPQLPAKICFSNASMKTQQCEFGVGVEVFDLKVVRFRDKEEPSSGVLLKTNTYGMGGGPVFISLWVYDKDVQRFRNILPAKMDVPALGGYKFFASLQGKIVLLIASPTRYIDFDANIDDPNRESLWSPHYYRVDIYRYELKRGFVKSKTFKTRQKYNPEDVEEDVNILIDLEMKTIKRLLR